MALTDQEIVRREKLQKLIDKGVDPFGQKFTVQHHSVEAKKLAEGKTHDDLEALGLQTSVAGRIVLLRNMGKASFITIQDKLGTIQAYIRKDVIGDDAYSIFELADLGDIVGVEIACQQQRGAGVGSQELNPAAIVQKREVHRGEYTVAG